MQRPTLQSTAGWSRPLGLQWICSRSDRFSRWSISSIPWLTWRVTAAA